MRAAIALSFCLIAVILLETTAQEPSVTGRRNVDFDEKTKIPDWNGQKIGSGEYCKVRCRSTALKPFSFSLRSWHEMEEV